MKTVLIFAHECAPYNRPQSTIGAQRPAQFAKYLPQFGWRAIVLCCANEQRNCAQVDFTLLTAQVGQQVAALKPDESAIIPTPSQAWDNWVDRHWRSVQSAAGKGLTRAQFIKRKTLTLAKYFSGDWSQNWQPCARVAAAAVAQQVKVDVCLGESGPDAGLFLAHWFARQYDVPWVVDFRDPLLRGINRMGRQVYGRVARGMLTSASSLINATPVWAEMDKKLFHRPAQSITNGFDPAEFAALPPVPPFDSNRLVIAFAGNIRETLEIFLAGLVVLQQEKPALAGRVLFAYWGLSATRVAELAGRYGVAELVQAHPHIRREEALAYLRQADLLLLLNLPNEPKKDKYLARGLYPGKVFEYFGLRKPILCVPGDNGLLDALLAETVTGQVANTAAEVAACLAAKVEQWQTGRPLPYQPSEMVMALYTRRNQTRDLAQVLDEALANRHRAK